jgi:SAM-dependent methyltransferase
MTSHPSDLPQGGNRIANRSLCGICTNESGNSRHRFREMFFGTREEFDYLECGVCGTIQLAESLDLSNYYPEGYYSLGPAPDLGSRTWMRRHVTAAVGKHMIGRRNPLGRFVARQRSDIRELFPSSLRHPALHLNQTSKILDVGCGQGHLLIILRYFGFNRLTGVDPFIVEDFELDPVTHIHKSEIAAIEGNFDLIMFHHSLEHVENPAVVLKKAWELLEESGTCLVRVPIVSWAWKEYGRNWIQLDPPRHTFLFTEKALVQLATSIGFQVEDIVYDSSAFQFWGSEQIQKDIPIKGAIEGGNEYVLRLFGDRQVRRWEDSAARLNRARLGDQACFYLRRL